MLPDPLPIRPKKFEGVPASGEIIADKYEVERVLGAGGMGVVVAARHVQLGEKVALKFLHAEGDRRARRS
jgi:serine/threonine-protein kinase